jgi:hypothetical protein
MPTAPENHDAFRKAKRIRFAPATIRFVDKKKKQKRESCRNKN